MSQAKAIAEWVRGLWSLDLALFAIAVVVVVVVPGLPPTTRQTLILGLTALILVWYTHYTRLLASGLQRAFATLRIRFNKDADRFDVWLRNPTNQRLKVFVRATVTCTGRSYTLPGPYSGESFWRLDPHGRIKGEIAFGLFVPKVLPVRLEDALALQPPISEGLTWFSALKCWSAKHIVRGIHLKRLGIQFEIWWCDERGHCGRGHPRRWWFEYITAGPLEPTFCPTEGEWYEFLEQDARLGSALWDARRPQEPATTEPQA